MGLYGSTTGIGNAEPSALTDIIGLAFDSTDSNTQIMHKDGSGTATKVNLGTN